MGVSLGKSGARFRGCLDTQYVLVQHEGSSRPSSKRVPVTIQVPAPSNPAVLLECEQCFLEAQQGSLASFTSSMTIEEPYGTSQSVQSLEHTHTAGYDWNQLDRIAAEDGKEAEVCAACYSVIYADDSEAEDSLVVQIHHGREEEEEEKESKGGRSMVGSPEEATFQLFPDNVSALPEEFIEKGEGCDVEEEDDCCIEPEGATLADVSGGSWRVRHHHHHRVRHRQPLPCLTAVDVEPGLLNSCQGSLTPAPLPAAFQPAAGARSNDPPLHVGPFQMIQVAGNAIKRRASIDGDGASLITATYGSGTGAPPAVGASTTTSSNGNRRPVIRLTSVDGLELNLTSPRQEDDPASQSASSSSQRRTSLVRCGAKRPPTPYMFTSSTSVASGPKSSSSKDDSNLDYKTTTSNGDNYTGPETLTIMRRSSSKRRSAGAAGPTINELDDSALESQIDLLNNDEDPPLLDADHPTAQVCENASLRLKCLLRLLDKGEVRPEVLQKNLKLAVQVLDSVYLDDTESVETDETSPTPPPQCPSSLFPSPSPTPPLPHSLLPAAAKSTSRAAPNPAQPPTARQRTVKKRRSPDEEDDLSEVRADAVPPEVRAWLASTFTRQLSTSHRKPGEDKPKFRSVAQAIRAGILVERIYRRMSSSSFLQFPAEVARNLKSIDEWTFDVFALSEASAGSPLRYLGIDLLNRYGVIHKFKIPTSTLEAFLTQTEAGYCKHRNLYHNNTHAADVAQTLHHMLYQTGLMNWLTDLEIFAAILAAIIHDFEHTGTTNSFHVMSGSETALLYNDRSVQENHHISAAFRLMKEEECNILVNLSREEYREFRGLVIDMVLSTDMSCHFQQIKAAKNLLAAPDLIVDKSRILSLVLHCCDVSHPSKPWALHRHWTDLLLEEFFRQGDNEKELGLPYSPLCDRNTTLVAESQIGFIEFIVEPSMTVMGDLLERILLPTRTPGISGRDSISEEKSSDSAEVEAVPGVMSKEEMEGEPAKSGGVKVFHRPWNIYLDENKAAWKELSIKEQQKRLEEARRDKSED